MRTSVESRSTLPTCTSDGSNDTSNAESGESKANQPPRSRTSKVTSKITGEVRLKRHAARPEDEVGGRP